MMIKRRRKIKLSERRDKIDSPVQVQPVGNHLAVRLSQCTSHYLVYLSLPANYTEKLSVHCVQNVDKGPVSTEDCPGRPL